MMGKRLRSEMPGLCLSRKCAIEACPAVLFHLMINACEDLPLGARTQPFGGQFAGAMAHAVGNVVAGNDQVPPGFVLAAQHNVGVRVVGIPVVDGDPIQASTQVARHAIHQVTGEGTQVP